MPLGPKDVFMRLATVRAAMILIYCKTASKILETIRESQFGFLQKKFKSGSRSTLDSLKCILKSVKEIRHSDHLKEENWYEIITYFVGFKTLDSLFLLLFAENDERSAVLVKCKTHDTFLWSSKWDKRVRESWEVYDLRPLLDFWSLERTYLFKRRNLIITISHVEIWIAKIGDWAKHLAPRLYLWLW